MSTGLAILLVGLLAPTAAPRPKLQVRERAIDLPRGAPFRHASLRVEYRTWSMGLGPEGGPDVFARSTLQLDDLPPLRVYEDYAKQSWQPVRGMIRGTWQLLPSPDGRALALSFDGTTWYHAYLEVELHGARHPFVYPEARSSPTPAPIGEVATSLLQGCTTAYPPHLDGSTPDANGDVSYGDWTALEASLAYALGHSDDEAVFSAMARCVAASGPNRVPERPLGPLDAAAVRQVREQLSRHPAVRAELEQMYREHTALARRDQHEEETLAHLETLLGTLPPALRRPSIEGTVRGPGGASPEGMVELWTEGADPQPVAQVPIVGGAFSFSSVADGGYQLVAVPSDHSAPVRRYVRAPAHQVELQLLTGLELKVVVRDHGKPVARAKLVALVTRKPAPSRPPTCTTDAEGACLLQGLAHDAYQVEVTAPEEPCLATEIYAPPASGWPTLAVDLASFTLLEGTLTDWRGFPPPKKPIARARLRAQPWGGLEPDACTTRDARTDSAGHFVFYGLPSDRDSYQLFLIGKGQPRPLGTVSPRAPVEVQLQDR